MTPEKFRTNVARFMAELEGELSGVRIVLARKSLSTQDVNELRERARFARSICAGLATECDGEHERRTRSSLLP